MAAAIYEPALRLCSNRAGANLASGVASALLACRASDLGVFEVDEAALPGVAAALQPRVVVLGNLFRDQLDRYGELEAIGERWRTLAGRLPDTTWLVRNGDDPLVASVGRGRQRLLSFGVDDRRAALPAMQHAADSKWCVVCGAPYRYAAVYLGHLGDYRCDTCGDARPRLDVRATDVHLHGLDASSFTLVTPHGSARVRLPVPGLYNVYNALAAAALACVVAPAGAGALPSLIAAGLGRFSAAFGRFERLRLGEREALLLLVKNPAGANEVVRTLTQTRRQGRVALLALNDRIADGRDVSWIWDVDLEPLVPTLEAVVVSGRRAADLAVRLKYAGLEPTRMRVVPRLGAALDEVARLGSGPVELIATYTAMLELRAQLVARGALRPYWEEAA
jgi:UDP-N-acetylmuramyl tripeptide synthase